MKKFAITLAGVLFAIILAAISVAITVGIGLKDSGVTNGPWSTNLSVGGADADLYTRAAVAIGGLLALSKEETIYFTAFEDSDGDTLTEDCSYQIEGNDPDARWWSITIYALDNYLVVNDDDHPSVAQTTVSRTKPGHFIATVSPQAQAENWISSRNAGSPFSLTLRLYNPGERVYSSPETTPLPTIKKGECK